jgi:hypothetical protein
MPSSARGWPVPEHTKGPWDTWHDYGGIYHIDAVDYTEAVDSDGEKFMLADNVRGEGNARLIAAAPDLLMACKAMREFIRENTKSGWVDPSCTLLADMAIAKAEGRPS